MINRFKQCAPADLESAELHDFLGTTEPEWFREYLMPSPQERSAHLLRRLQRVAAKGNAVTACSSPKGLCALMALEKQEWDTNHFGFSCARLAPVCNTPLIEFADRHTILEEGIRQASESGVHLLQRRILSSRTAEITALEQQGFTLADNVCTLFSRQAPAHEERADLRLRTAEERDVESVLAMSENAFTLSRFVQDPVFCRNKGAQVYSNWIRNTIVSPQGHIRCLVAESGNTVAGYIAFTLEACLGRKLGEISLFLVNESFRGKGIGKYLLTAAFSALSATGAEWFEATTWMHNRAAMGLYQSAGLRVVENMFTFHRVL